MFLTLVCYPPGKNRLERNGGYSCSANPLSECIWVAKNCGCIGKLCCILYLHGFLTFVLAVCICYLQLVFLMMIFRFVNTLVITYNSVLTWIYSHIVMPLWVKEIYCLVKVLFCGCQRDLLSLWVCTCFWVGFEVIYAGNAKRDIFLSETWTALLDFRHWLSNVTVISRYSKMLAGLSCV